MKYFLELLLSFIFPMSDEERRVYQEIHQTTSQSLLTKAPSILSLPHEDMYSALNYQNILVKKIIWQLKYKNEKNFAKLLSACLYPGLLEELSDKKLFENFTNTLLIPIPLSKSRFRERGFNQSELLCRELSLLDQHKNFSLDTSVLYRIKDNEHQARLKDRGSRFKNSEETFAVLNKRTVLNRNVILLDDVITSGATILSARKVLLASGAKNVFMISVAH